MCWRIRRSHTSAGNWPSEKQARIVAPCRRTTCFSDSDVYLAACLVRAGSRPWHSRTLTNGQSGPVSQCPSGSVHRAGGFPHDQQSLVRPAGRKLPVDVLQLVLAAAPQLPHAACIGRSELFDVAESARQPRLTPPDQRGLASGV